MYAHVVDNQIVAEWDQLPTTLGDVANLSELSADELAELGVHPVIEVGADFNPLTHKCIGKVIGIYPSGNVVRTYELAVLTPEEAEQAAKDEEQKVKRPFIVGIQAMLDTEAQKYGYDDIKSAAIRAGYPGPFNQQGVALATWMDNCWNLAYQILADVKNGSREMPTVQQILAEMPTFTMPG